MEEFVVESAVQRLLDKVLDPATHAQLQQLRLERTSLLAVQRCNDDEVERLWAVIEELEIKVAEASSAVLPAAQEVVLPSAPLPDVVSLPPTQTLTGPAAVRHSGGSSSLQLITTLTRQLQAASAQLRLLQQRVQQAAHLAVPPPREAPVLHTLVGRCLQRQLQGFLLPQLRAEVAGCLQAQLPPGAQPQLVRSSPPPQRDRWLPPPSFQQEQPSRGQPQQRLFGGDRAQKFVQQAQRREATGSEPVRMADLRMASPSAQLEAAVGERGHTQQQQSSGQAPKQGILEAGGHVAAEETAVDNAAAAREAARSAVAVAVEEAPAVAAAAPSSSQGEERAAAAEGAAAAEEEAGVETAEAEAAQADAQRRALGASAMARPVTAGQVLAAGVPAAVVQAQGAERGTVEPRHPQHQPRVLPAQPATPPRPQPRSPQLRESPRGREQPPHEPGAAQNAGKVAGSAKGENPLPARPALTAERPAEERASKQTGRGSDAVTMAAAATSAGRGPAGVNEEAPSKRAVPSLPTGEVAGHAAELPPGFERSAAKGKGSAQPMLRQGRGVDALTAMQPQKDATGGKQPSAAAVQRKISINAKGQGDSLPAKSQPANKQPVAVAAIAQDSKAATKQPPQPLPKDGAPLPSKPPKAASAAPAPSRAASPAEAWKERRAKRAQRFALVEATQAEVMPSAAALRSGAATPTNQPTGAAAALVGRPAAPAPAAPVSAANLAAPPPVNNKLRAGSSPHQLGKRARSVEGSQVATAGQRASEPAKRRRIPGPPQGAPQQQQEHDVPGMIFICSDMTIDECKEGLIFGLPQHHWNDVRRLEPGAPLFLFNISDRTLHGIYRASSSGKWEINPYAWARRGQRTSFPCQVAAELELECPPLTESRFKPIMEENYLPRSEKFHLAVSATVALELCRLFQSEAKRRLRRH